MPSGLRAMRRAPETTNPAKAGLRCEFWPLEGAKRHKLVAERAGFEPAVGINPHTLSRRATSTTHPPLREAFNYSRQFSNFRRCLGLC